MFSQLYGWSFCENELPHPKCKVTKNFVNYASVGKDIIFGVQNSRTPKLYKLKNNRDF